MRARSLLLFGVGLAAFATIVGAVFAATALEPHQRVTGGFLAAGASLAVLVAAVGAVAGWFGREHSDVALVAIGAGAGAGLGGLALGLADDDASIAAALVGIGVVVLAGLVAQGLWRVGDAICDLRELPNMSRLVPPAFPDEYPGSSMWTTEAGPTLRATLDRLADTIAPTSDVAARAIGIRHALPRDRPIAIVLAGDRLGIQPVDMSGRASGEPLVIGSTDLAEVSIRSEAADGTERRHVNAYDDLVWITSASGERLRLRLAYGTRGAGTGTGGPDAIRAWLRTNAAAYR